MILNSVRTPDDGTVRPKHVEVKWLQGSIYCKCIFWHIKWKYYTVMNPPFLFQPNAHNMLNTYIYHQIHPTCFGVCHTIFRETTALFAHKLYVFCIFAVNCSKTICFLQFFCNLLKNHMLFAMVLWRAQKPHAFCIFTVTFSKTIWFLYFYCNLLKNHMIFAML